MWTILIEKNVSNQFKLDFIATTTISSVIKKLWEIRQIDNESVIQYVSQSPEILLELKTKTDVLDVKMQL
jgi:hypothetical protein